MGEKERHRIFINLRRGLLLKSALLLIPISWAQAQELKPIKLMDPDKAGNSVRSTFFRKIIILSIV